MSETATATQYRTYAVGGGWGCRIEWFSHKSGREVQKVNGWMDAKPKPGDLLTSGMQSGKTGVFVFLKINACADPPDMFFADVAFAGYRGETATDAEIERLRPSGTA